MGCVQSRDGGGDRTLGGSVVGGAAAPQQVSSDFMADVHKKRLEAANPGAAYKDQQDALGRYEALVDVNDRPVDYRSRDAAWLRAEVAKRRRTPL